MDKDKFLFLLANSASLTEKETSELAVLKDQFPYSQPIHNLLARGAQLNNLPIKQSVLTQAAVYATDRTLLKSIITSLPGERKTEWAKKEETPIKQKQIVDSKPAEITKPEVANKVVEVSANKPPKVEVGQPSVKPSKPESISAKVEFKGSTLGGDELIDELFHDLDRLKKLKHDFEAAVEQFEPSHPPEIKEKKTAAKVEAPVPDKPKKNSGGIIAEIKSTKKKIKPSDPKQKEQLEIIDQFIKSKPSIRKNKDSPPANTSDLSESSSVFTDNIVSETLVEILIKQGKKEKAIEVLKKLIWKFPQKKAYFAAQIEELTN